MEKKLSGFVIIIIVVLMGLFVLFLPNINKFFNKGVENSNRNGTYTCKLTKKDENLHANITREVIFKIEDRNVVSYTLTSTYKYDDLNYYNNKKNEQQEKHDGITIKTKQDDNNMTFKKEVKADISIAKANDLDFPIKQAEMENFVKEKGYNCNY